MEDHCRAIDLIIHKGRIGEVYNIGSHNEKKNIDVVKMICRATDKPYSLIKHISDRKGHDLRYAISASKICKELEWTPLFNFERELTETIYWYITNHDWWKNTLNNISQIE